LFAFEALKVSHTLLVVVLATSKETLHQSPTATLWCVRLRWKQPCERCHASRVTPHNIAPMVEKLLLIKSFGYFPNDIHWSGVYCSTARFKFKWV